MERPEVLLIRRSPGRILPGLWQCVSGSLEPGERVAAGALRELAEETGFGPPDIEAFYDLDLVNQFHEPSYDAIVTAAVLRGPTPARRRADASRTSTTTPAGCRSTRPTSRSSGRATGRPSSGSATTCPSPERAGLVRADARRRPRRVRPRVAEADALVDSGTSRQPTVRRHRRAT